VIATLASIDGVNFYGTSTWGNSQGWVERRFDLSNVTTLGDLTGRPQVWVALIFASDGSENYPEGAYVDNIVLRKYVQGSSRARMERIPSGPVPGSESLKQVPAHKVLGWEPGNSGDRE